MMDETLKICDELVICQMVLNAISTLDWSAKQRVLSHVKAIAENDLPQLRGAIGGLREQATEAIRR